MNRRPATVDEAKALANSLRLRILRLTLDQALTNKQLAERLDRDPGTVLHHVRRLVEWKGNEKYGCIQFRKIATWYTRALRLPRHVQQKLVLLSNLAEFEEVIVTNTLPIPEDRRFDSLTVLSIAPLIARAIREVFEEGSVTSLFNGQA